MRDRDLNRTIDAAIKKRLAAIIPEFDKDAPGGWLTGEKDINVDISWPRPGMGRFDDGKLHWTIDISEHATFSRTKQVRVKVAADNSVSFDEKKVLSHLAAVRAIVAADKAQKEALNKSAAALPPLPTEIVAEPVSNGLYNVRVHYYHLKLDDVKRLAGIIREFNTTLK